MCREILSAFMKHLDDLAGHVEELDDWLSLRVPAIAGEDSLIPIGREKFHYRQPGDVLHPEREPLVILEQMRRALGSATALMQQLRYEPNGIVYPTPFVLKDDKLTHLHAQSAWIEAGHIWLPERAPWLEDLRIEIVSVPQGRNDDQIDSISQFLSWHYSKRGMGNGSI
ncbi:hypothetical protein OKA06_06065 [Novosphingobium sp. MW5]|nr:hypothetical protein [Novosphingobium sp. MW5]